MRCGYRTLRLGATAAALVIVLVASGCDYSTQARQARAAGDPQPWFCAPTAPNSVTGIGMGTVDFYAGQLRKNLLWDECEALAGQIDQARAYARQYPTRGVAEAAGFRLAFGFFSGMGTHHSRTPVTEALLNSPTFDRNDPIIPNSSSFDPTRPDTLQYDGEGADARLVGMSWYIRSTNGPPAGFAGGADRWHHHPRLCFRKVNPTIIGVNTTDGSCAASGGVNLNMERYYMLHLWVVDDLEYHADVFAPTHPCIRSGGSIFDMAHPCHDTPPAPTPRSKTPTIYCPLGTLAPKG